MGKRAVDVHQSRAVHQALKYRLLVHEERNLQACIPEEEEEEEEGEKEGGDRKNEFCRQAYLKPELTWCLLFLAAAHHPTILVNSSFHASVHCDIVQTTLFHVCMELMHLGQLVSAGPYNPCS